MTKERYDYLKELAEDYGIDLNTVLTIADMLGEEEDYDGLISTLNDLPVNLPIE